jgi:hypothetical protein
MALGKNALRPRELLNAADLKGGKQQAPDINTSALLMTSAGLSSGYLLSTIARIP